MNLPGGFKQGLKPGDLLFQRWNFIQRNQHALRSIDEFHPCFFHVWNQAPDLALIGKGRCSRAKFGTAPIHYSIAFPRVYPRHPSEKPSAGTPPSGELEFRELHRMRKIRVRQ